MQVKSYLVESAGIGLVVDYFKITELFREKADFSMKIYTIERKNSKNHIKKKLLAYVGQVIKTSLQLFSCLVVLASIS